MTKKEYSTKKKEIESSINLFKSMQENYETIFNNEQNDEHVKDQYGMFWNTAEDALYILKQELKDLNDQWDKRNWTYQDHVQYDLMTSNID